MKRTSLIVTLTATLALALAACGGDDGASTDSSPTDTSPSVRTVVDGAGRSVEVPASPSRVVFMDETTMGNAATAASP